MEWFPNRYVLLGGPGSGKSTVGQFLAQIHRAAILDRRKPQLLEPQTRQTIRETRELCDREGLPWAATPRYPFRIELNRFAKALAAKGDERIESLGRYLLNEIKGDHALEYGELLNWLSIYPWLLILDGLDEVPPTSNRDTVVKAVNDFLAQARQAGADLFIVATSRQQGYGGEFAAGLVAFRHLFPLSKARALRYIERYAQARFGANDPHRKKDLIDKLRRSADRELTAQLLSTPLQVTFLATVVAAQGDPGDQRWQLFHSYYRTIYDRERQKAVPPYNEILSKWQVVIDRLHHDVGFLLQRRGETTGEHAVSLPIPEFRELVDQYLTNDGHEGEEKERLVRLITEAAQHRLVFLTARVEGELSFDVRSLQEYMASECIMSGLPELIRARLRAIAPALYWRNVFLFAAGKCFADVHSRHLQDPIPLLCEELNSAGDRLLIATRGGSELALDILQSGAVAENPNHGRQLVMTALALLAQPYLVEAADEGATADRRLAVVYRKAFSTQYRESLELRLGQTDLDRALGAWTLLGRLIENGVEWGLRLVSAYWPTDSTAKIRLLSYLVSTGMRMPWLVERLAEVMLLFPVEDAWAILRKLSRGLGGEAAPPDFESPLSPLIQLAGHEYERLGIPLALGADVENDIEFEITSVADAEELVAASETLAQLPAGKPYWLPLALATDFLRCPGAEKLAAVLQRCLESGWDPSIKFYPPVPWPLAACLESVGSTEDVWSLISLIRGGKLGDVEHWRAAESRWSTRGIDVNDLQGPRPRIAPFDSSIAEHGFPNMPHNLRMITRAYLDSVISELLYAAEALRPGRLKDGVVWCLLHAGAAGGSLASLAEPRRLRGIMEAAGHVPGWWTSNVIRVPDRIEVLDAWLDFFDWLGRSDWLGSRAGPSAFDGDWRDVWQDAFVKDPARTGLLRLLGRLAAHGHAITKIPRSLLVPGRFDEARMRFAAVLVRLSQSDLSVEDARYCAGVMPALLDPAAEPWVETQLAATIGKHLDSVPSIRGFLLHLHSALAAGFRPAVAICEQLLRRIARRRPSELPRLEHQKGLGLPPVSVARHRRIG